MELVGNRAEVWQALHNALQAMPIKRRRNERAELDYALFIQHGDDWTVTSTDGFMMAVTVCGEAEHWLKVATTDRAAAGRESMGVHAIDLEKLVKMAKPKKAERDDVAKLTIEQDLIGFSVHKKGSTDFESVAPSIERTKLGIANVFPNWRHVFTDSYMVAGFDSVAMLSTELLARLAKFDGGTVMARNTEVPAPLRFRMTGTLKPVNFAIGRTEIALMPMRPSDLEGHYLEWANVGKTIAQSMGGDS